MSSPVRPNVGHIFYSPEKSPSSPLAACSLPGVIKTPSPRKIHAGVRGKYRFRPTESPSRDVRRALKQLNLGTSQQVSPETQQIHAGLREINSRGQTRLRKISRRMHDTFKKAAEKYEKSAENGWIAQLEKCPMINPPRANTRVYSEGSEELNDLEKVVGQIKDIQATGLPRMPHDLPFLAVMPKLGLLPETVIQVHEAKGKSKEAIDLYAKSYARSTRRGPEQQPHQQQPHLQAWLPPTPE